jgi:N-acetylmuramoyl-L-alanine amidase
MPDCRRFFEALIGGKSPCQAGFRRYPSASHAQVITTFFALLFCVAAAHAADWKLIKVGGRDHVTLANVAEFYGLGGVQRVSNTFTLRLGSRSLRGRAGSVEFYINNLKFNLSYPIAEHNGQLYISRMDLTKVIEPVLRPSRIAGAEKVDTIVLDAGHGGHDRARKAPTGTRKISLSTS